MSIRFFTMALLLLSTAFTTTAQTTTHEESGYVPEGYQLDWSDEFDGDELNTSDWKFEIKGPGWVNHERQRYVGKTFGNQKIVSVEDGRLSITARKVYTANGDYEDAGGKYSIVSGRIYARPNEGWRYGYIEARIKLPKGKGTWPAFWMMPVNFTSWPADGEIDIMEEVGYHPNYVSSSLHATAHVHSNGTQVTHEMLCNGAEDDYHIYGIEWTADRITTYVDGQVQLNYPNRGLGRDDWPYDSPFYIILNLAWGGDWGGAQGTDESKLPAELLVDYVRVYKKPAPATAKKVIAYVTSWSSIMPDPHMMTHINYAFAGVGDNYKVFLEGESRLKQIIKLKERNPDLKVLISVGGWGRGKFTPMAASEEGRKTFAESCRKLCEDYNLDGIDIDWEFPGNNSSEETSPSNEKQNYTLLMHDLREALGDEYLLTMASSSSPDYYDYKNCIQYLDFVNVMTYDMASPPYHHSALYRGGTVGNGWSVSHESIQNHLKAGIPADKLVMGLAFYGNGNGDGSGSANQVSLQEIENGIASGKWIDHWDNVAKVPYVTNTNGQFVFGYDNARSLTLKCQYIIDNDLAGGMYWEYSNDNNAGTERNTVFDCLRGYATKKENLKLGEYDLEYTTGNTYTTTADFTQGESYAAIGTGEMTSNDWYYDPDFFARNDDGTYRFTALSGKYRVSADFNDNCFKVVPVDDAGNPLTYNTTDGTGCIWVIGADGSYGKPFYSSGTGWTESRALPMAAVGKNKFQITFEVGKQLNPSQVNFKFFHQNSFGNDSSDEFNTRGSSKISTTSDVFYVNYNTSDNGNVKLRSGKSLKSGDTYRFTIDTTDPANAKLSVEQVIATGLNTVKADTRHPAAIYDLQGRRVDGTAPLRKGIYIRDGRKMVIGR